MGIYYNIFIINQMENKSSVATSNFTSFDNIAEGRYSMSDVKKYNNQSFDLYEPTSHKSSKKNNHKSHKSKNNEDFSSDSLFSEYSDNDTIEPYCADWQIFDPPAEQILSSEE